MKKAIYMHGLLVAAVLVFWCLPVFVDLHSGMSLRNRLAGFSSAYPLGSDALGRDLALRFQQCIWDAIIPLWSVVALATFVGVMAFVVLVVVGNRQSKLADTCNAVLRQAMVVVTAIPVVVLGFIGCLWYGEADIFGIAWALLLIVSCRTCLYLDQCRVASEQRAYWLAHEAFGGSRLNRMLRYGLCQDWRQQFVNLLAFHMGMAVVIEASIGYLGFGIAEPKASLGNILSSHFDLYLKGEAHTVLVTVCFLALLSFFPYSLMALVRLALRPQLLAWIWARKSGLPRAAAGEPFVAAPWHREF